MRFTDKTIEIRCGECQKLMTGVDYMANHIMQDHREYTPIEAVKFAREWADDAYDQEEEFECSYYEQRKLDDAIDSDSFPKK